MDNLIAGARSLDGEYKPALLESWINRAIPNQFAAGLVYTATQIAIPWGGMKIAQWDWTRRAISKGVLADLRSPARELLENEDVLIDESLGLQSRTKGRFQNVIQGKHRDLSTKYLWTIDERGVNIALETTPFPTPRGNIVHSNISSKASIAGEAWFASSKKVIINAGSGRFGYGSATLKQWKAAIRYWRSLGYRVKAIPFGKR